MFRENYQRLKHYLRERENKKDAQKGGALIIALLIIGGIIGSSFIAYEVIHPKLSTPTSTENKQSQQKEPSNNGNNENEKGKNNSGETQTPSEQTIKCLGADRKYSYVTKEVCDATKKYWTKILGSFPTDPEEIIQCKGADEKYSIVSRKTCEDTNNFWSTHKVSSSSSSSNSSSSSSSNSSSSSSSNSSSSSSSNSSSSSSLTASCTYTSYDTTIYNDNPVAFWELGDSSSTTLDCSSNKNHNGTYVNSPTTTTSSNGDTVRVFDGATQYVQTVDAADLSVTATGILTLEAWMRPDILEFPHSEGTGYVHWMGKGTTNQQEYVARMYSLTNSENRPNRISGYAFNLSGGTGVGSYFQDTVTVGQWIHYVAVINTVDTSSTYPTGYTKIYKNGALRDQDSLSGSSIVPGNGTEPFRIATRDLNSYFQGAIGKVAIYNKELTNQQIVNHYQAMIPPVAGTASFVNNIGSTSTQTAGTTMTITVPSTIPVGHTLIARVLASYSSGAPTITDNRGNTYTRDRTAPFTGNIVMRASIFSASISAALQAGDTITITTASLTTRMAVIDEFSGLLTSSYLDQQNGGVGTSTTPGTAISITTTQANELLIGMVAVNGNTENTYAEDTVNSWNSLTRAGTNSGSGDLVLNGAYKSVSATGTYKYTPTLGTLSNWIDFIVSYKAL